MKRAATGMLLLAGMLFAGTAAAKTTLSVMVKVDITNEWKALFAQYEKLNPDIEIKPYLQNMDWPPYYEKIVTMQAGGANVDVVYVDRQAVPYVKKGLFVDLTPYIKQDKINKADYPAVGWKQYYLKGQQVAFPVAIYPSPMFINKTLLAQSGVAEPSQDWKDTKFTTDVFATMLTKLTRDTNADGIKDYYGTCGWTGGAIDASFGAEWIDSSRDKVTANSKQMIEAKKYWYHLDKDLHVVSDDKFNTFYKVNWDHFSSNRIGMMTSGSWAMSMYKDPKYNWDLGIVPLAKRRAITATVDGFAIAGQSKNKKAAWEFIKWIGTNKTGASMLNDCLGGCPVLESSMSRYIDNQKKEYPKVNMNVLRQCLNYADVDTYNLYPNNKQIEEAIWSTMDLVDQGKMSLLAGLDMIQSKLEKLLD